MLVQPPPPLFCIFGQLFTVIHTFCWHPHPCYLLLFCYKQEIKICRQWRGIILTRKEWRQAHADHHGAVVEPQGDVHVDWEDDQGQGHEDHPQALKPTHHLQPVCRKDNMIFKIIITFNWFIISAISIWISLQMFDNFYNIRCQSNSEHGVFISCLTQVCYLYKIISWYMWSKVMINQKQASSGRACTPWQSVHCRRVIEAC